MKPPPPLASGPSAARRTFVFVVLIGVVSLFSDLRHEAARGITGASLAALGRPLSRVGVYLAVMALVAIGYAGFNLIS